MKKSFRLISIFFALLLVSSCSFQDEEMNKEDFQLKNGDLTQGTEISPDIKGRYIVVFRDQVTDPAAETARLRGMFGLGSGHVYENVFKGFSASIPEQALNGLKNHPLIAYVEPDILMHTCEQVIPTGVRRIEADLNAIAAIKQDGGEVAVDVAIIDTGIDKEHPELNVKGGVRFYLGFLTDSRYDDDNGHGSHVGGIIGARDNTSGVVGVAPGAGLYAVKVLNSKGSGYLSDIIKGLDWVRARASEIEVINMSLGGQGLSSSYHTAIKNCVAAGIVVVVAAGNESMDVYGDDGTFGTTDDVIPAAYPEAAAISALADTDGEPGGTGSGTNYGADDTFASFSNYSNFVVTSNPVNSPGKAIDLILPGVSIYSCYKDVNYATMSGTSMASPHAAGLAALYIAEKGRATDATGVYAIRQALIDMGKAQTSPEGLKGQSDPDPFNENLGWAGVGIIPENQPPVANFTYTASGLTATFTNQSTDAGGSISSSSWDFGDLTTSTAASPVHTYASGGTYLVKLVVTDNGGLTGSVAKDVTVTSTPNPTEIALTAAPQVVKSRLKVALTWTPAIIADIYRNGLKIATSTSLGTYTDNVKNSGTYIYHVQSGGISSNTVTINAPVPAP